MHGLELFGDSKMMIVKQAHWSLRGCAPRTCSEVESQKKPTQPEGWMGKRSVVLCSLAAFYFDGTYCAVFYTVSFSLGFAFFEVHLEVVLGSG